MPSPIEDYGFISDTHSAALVARDGSIDWLTFPRYDSGACLAALLGDNDNGRWKLAPASHVLRTERRYRPDTLVLETVFHTAEGSVAVIDCMPPRDHRVDLIRLVQGRTGRVPMRMELTLRMDYGYTVPWVRQTPGGITAVAGPEGLRLTSPVELVNADYRTVAQFEIDANDHVPFILNWYPSDREAPLPIEGTTAVAVTEAWWRDWSAQCNYDGDYGDEVRDSLRVLKGLTYTPSGGVVAAGTTSLPEAIGGPRNWDYRYCWLRDATFTLISMLESGYTEEAVAWRDWLLRAVAGKSDQLQIMYGPEGERRLTEIELPWLRGYERSKPVRIGNAASEQFQLDVYGEVLDALWQTMRVHGADHGPAAWDLACNLADFLEGHWKEPDDGIWEMRGGRQHFTHSKVMAWVGIDRILRAADLNQRPAPTDRWTALRDEIRDDVLANGVDDRGVFTQAYGSSELDASMLMVPLVGFLPPGDARVVNTVAAIERELTSDGFVRRYRPTGVDGLEGGEGVFLMCTFWLADNYMMMGRHREARQLFEKLLGLRNDLGLLAEQYDPEAKRQLGNLPQAFSHVALVNTATNLSGDRAGAASRRGSGAAAGH